MLEIVRIPAKPSLRRPHTHIPTTVLLDPLYVQHTSGITYECVPVTGQNVMENGTEWNETEGRDRRWARGGGWGSFDWRAKGTRPAAPQVARQGCAILIPT